MNQPPKFTTSIDPASVKLLREIFDDAVDEFMDELVEEAEFEWRRAAADSNLKTTRQKYMDAIVVEREGDSVKMSLNDPLASAIESGSEPFDLKPGFLGNRLSRTIPLVRNVGHKDFKTLTTTSRGWKHPGIHPRRITERVSEKVEQDIANDLFSKALTRSDK